MTPMRTAAAVFLLAIGGLPLRADVILDANNLILGAIRDASTSPPAASRNLAILHTAVFDAVNGIDYRYQPYRVAPAAPAGSSIDAAAAAAAYTVMQSLYTSPAQQAASTSFFNSVLSGIPDGPAKSDGVAWGQLVANNIVAWRATDGWNAATPPYTGGLNPGDWRPTPPGNLPGALPQWGNVAPWSIASAAAYRPGGPPALDSAEYAFDYDQVYNFGARTGSLRTPEMEFIANFWKNDVGTETPPGHWNAIAQTVVVGRVDDTVDRARVFAAMNVAMADAAIAAWDTKYSVNFWRPVTAIREGDDDGNAFTVGDVNWEPYLDTPNHPDYVSGHSTFSGAGSYVLASLLGTDSIAFTVDSDSTPGQFRSFSSLSQAAEESGMSRIYGGIHFMSANTDGLAMGRGIGDWVIKNGFIPIPEPSTTFSFGAGVAVLLLRRRRS